MLRTEVFEHDVDTSICVENMKVHTIKDRFEGEGEISI